MQFLGGQSPGQFLAEFWQKKPLFVKAACPDLVDTIPYDELMAIACEDGVQCSLLMERGGDYAWQLHEGPFEEESLAALGRSLWTLSVRELERHYPEMTFVHDSFGFIPNWRKDDVAAILSTAQATDGPYLNDSDRFLINTLGQAQWRLAPAPADPILETHQDIDLVASFQPTQTWEAGPGDLLYLPPGYIWSRTSAVRHMVVSVSCFAPRRSELVRDWAATSGSDPRYQDPDLTPRANPNLIKAEEVARVKALVTSLLEEGTGFEEWFGRYVTATTNRLVEPPKEPFELQEFKELLAEVGSVRRSELVRWAFRDGPGATLFVDGKAYPLRAELADRLTQKRELSAADAAGMEELLCELANQGYLELEG